MACQTTLATAFTVSGAGLHTGRTATVTLRPAAADTGRCVASSGPGEAVRIAWDRWVSSRMSTSVGLGDGRTIRTIEHMMAALAAHGVDNVRIEIDGPEVPIFDGSARPWCRRLRSAGLASCAAPRRVVRVRQPVQVERDGGFLRAEPGDGFEIDVTHDVLPGFPVMRWAGAVDAARFDREIAASRSFGNLHRRLGLAQKPVARPRGEQAPPPNTPRTDLNSNPTPWPSIAAQKVRQTDNAPLLRGWRPWRATLIAGRRILPWPRFADEPVRHVALDMIGDLALVGYPLRGRFVAHNPSHEKTYALVAALMTSYDAWQLVDEDTPDP